MLKFLVGVTFSGFLAVVSSSFAQAVQEDLANSLHVFLVVDTNSNIGEACERNRDSVLQVFKEAFESPESDFQNRYQVTLIEGDEVAPERISQKIADAHIRADDAVLFFYTGHGGMDNEKGHFLATSGGDLSRLKVRSDLLDKKPRMLAIVTDSCSNAAEFAPRTRENTAKWRVVRDLFFQQTGFADIQSSQKDVESWTCVFTSAFVSTLCEPVDAIDENGDGIVAWEEYFQRVQAETLSVFSDARDSSRDDAEIRDAKPQTPYAFNLPTLPRKADAVISVSSWSDNIYFSSLTSSNLGDFLLTGDSDGKLRIWDPKTGNQVGLFEKPSQFVWSVVAAPGGKYGLSNELFYPPGNRESQNITRIWELESGKEISRVKLPGQHKGRLFVNDSRILMFDESNIITVWDTQEETAGESFDVHNYSFSAASLNDGKQLRVFDWSSKASKCRIASIDTMTERTTFSQLPAELRPWKSWLSANGQVVVMSLAPDTNEVGEVDPCKRRLWRFEFWDCDKIEQLKVIRNVAGRYPEVALSPDGRFAAIACEDDTHADESLQVNWETYPLGADIQVWDLSCNKKMLTIGDLPPILKSSHSRDMVFVNNGRSLAVSYGAEIRVYNLGSD